MLVTYLVVEWQLFYMMFIDNEFISHRIEFESKNLTTLQSLKSTLLYILNGNFLAYSIHRPTIIQVVSLFFGLALLLRILKIEKFNTFRSVIITIVFLAFFSL